MQEMEPIFENFRIFFAVSRAQQQIFDRLMDVTSDVRWDHCSVLISEISFVDDHAISAHVPTV